MELLFIGKSDDKYCERALEITKRAVPNARTFLGRRPEPMPEELAAWSGDYLISYLSPWIIPAAVLENASRAALNFHPGPPEYPGIGCTNFAIYNGENQFGVTCHHMAARVDTGPVVAVRRFPLKLDDSVWSLTQRCYEHIFELYREVLELIRTDRNLPRSAETWTRTPYRRTELNALCEVDPAMPEAEIRRRVRATHFPGMPGAHVRLAGLKFAFQPEES